MDGEVPLSGIGRRSGLALSRATVSGRSEQGDACPCGKNQPGSWQLLIGTPLQLSVS